jgi:tetratricopeptide (TPR) repeat protein
MTEPGDLRKLVEDALTLAASGRTGDAERLCREALVGRPDDFNVLAALGAILLKAGRTKEAEGLLRKSIELEPGFAAPHEDLGSLYLQNGMADQAIPYFEIACRLDPRRPSALLGLATALERAGRAAEADAARQRFLVLSPIDRALQDAATLMREGDAKAAEKICGEILSKDSKNVRALRLLAEIAAADGRVAAAEGLLRRLVRLAPDFHPGLVDMAEFLASRSRFHEAVEFFGKAIELRPDLAELHLKLADILVTINRPAEALDAYQGCLALSPDRYHALMGLGHMQRVLGRRDEAVTAYLRCTELHPQQGEAWWYLASIRGFEFTGEQQRTILSQLDAPDTDTRACISLRFAMARAYEAAGQFELAWQQYQQGNESMRQTVKYDPVEVETQIDHCIKVFGEDLSGRGKASPCTGPWPIFIVGLPRSGSTLIEQVLASHSQVDGCGELPYIIMLSHALGSAQAGDARYPEVLADMSTDELLKIGSDYLENSAVHRAKDVSAFTDKMPNNFMHIGMIHLALPQAVIIDARRQPLDTCIANYRQLFAQGKNQSYDLTELAEYYLEYIRIMKHWDAVLPGRVLRVQYEDMVGDLERQVRRILDHCGLPFEQSCLEYHKSKRPVNTVSSEQVRVPIYRDALGFWKNYEPHLDELKQILAPVL